MNSLSWFLYFIDVVASLGAMFGMTFVLLMIALGVLWISSAFAIEDASRERQADVRTSRTLWSWRLCVAAAICAFIGCFLPSKNTLYAIAASEVGERVIKNDAVQGIASDATKALQQWIKNQIEPPAKK